MAITLNTADGLPLTALGMTAFHLRITDFKFTHKFIISDSLPDTEIIFGIDIQKNSHYYMLGTRRIFHFHPNIQNIYVYIITIKDRK